MHKLLIVLGGVVMWWECWLFLVVLSGEWHWVWRVSIITKKRLRLELPQVYTYCTKKAPFIDAKLMQY